MFGFLKRKYELISPVDGKTIPLSTVPDKVFAEKLAGDGIAVEPAGDTIFAPADGELALVFETNHAFAVKTENGAEILVHIGIDTVSLKGQGFTRLKEMGQKVRAGEPIIKIDRNLIKEKGFPLTTILLVTNQDSFTFTSYNEGVDVKGGKDTVVVYKEK